MTSLCFFVQLPDRTLILKQREFFVYIIARRLFLNHSPSEWFSSYKKTAPVSGSGLRRNTACPFSRKLRRANRWQRSLTP